MVIYGGLGYLSWYNSHLFAERSGDRILEEAIFSVPFQTDIEPHPTPYALGARSFKAGKAHILMASQLRFNLCFDNPEFLFRFPVKSRYLSLLLSPPTLPVDPHSLLFNSYRFPPLHQYIRHSHHATLPMDVDIRISYTHSPVCVSDC